MLEDNVNDKLTIHLILASSYVIFCGTVQSLYSSHFDSNNVAQQSSYYFGKRLLPFKQKILQKMTSTVNEK